MPRIARGVADNEIYHIINRGNRRMEVFHHEEDYQKFLDLLATGKKTFAVKLYAYTLMPNHFHFVVEPNIGEELSKMMQWILTSYVRYYNTKYKTSGHLWQGRYKSFIVQKENYLTTLLHYVEANASRAGLVEKDSNWSFGSAYERLNDTGRNLLDEAPVTWEEGSPFLLLESELDMIRNCIARQAPLGDQGWQESVSARYGLESTLKPRGRPRKEKRDEV